MSELDAVESLRENIKSRRDSAVNLLGSTTGIDALTLSNRASEESTLELIGRGTSLNALWGVGQWTQRAFIDNDPNFRRNDHFDEWSKDVPRDYWDEFSGVQSLEEANLLKSQIKQELEDKQLLGAAGTRGFAAAALAGIVDIDAPLMFVSGGSYLGGKIAAGATKAGIEGTRVARTAELAGAGLEATVLTESANVMARPTGEWTDIPEAGLAGIVFGSSIGALSPTKKLANDSVNELKKSFAESKQNGETDRTDFTDTSVSDGGFSQFFSQDSVGAASTTAQGIDKDLLTENTMKMREWALKYNQDNGIADAEAFAFPNTPVGVAARKLHTLLSKSPAASDWDRMMNSNSAIATALAHKLFESPAGIVRNNKSAALLNNIYQHQIAAPVNVKYRDFYNEWAESNIKPGMNKMQAQFDNELRNKFNKEVLEELQYRYHDGASNPNSSDSVRKMADSIDEASAKAVGILQGRSSEPNVKGSENIKPETGWFPQRWRGDKISALIKEGVPKKAIEDALTTSYVKLYPQWDAGLANKFAKAVLRRAAAKERGIDTNLARMLDQEGRDFMEQFLVENGITKADATRLIKGLKGSKADQNKENILKQRRDVDLREPIAGTKYRVIDLVDSDIVPVWTQYSRQAAGASAMARHGIFKSDLKDLKNAIKMEEDANGGRTLSDDALDSVFSYFDGGAFAGGVNPWIRRGLQTTNLSLLNSLGLTQAAETGVNIAAVGWDAFATTAPKEVQALLSGKNSAVMEELKGLTAVIDGEHNIYRDYLALDEMKADPGHFSELGRFADNLLIKGSRVQGYLSGFYKMKQLQQRIAVRAMLHRLASNFQSGKAMSESRLYDIGLDTKTADRVGKYFKNGTVEMEADGSVLRMNFKDWKPEDMDDLAAALNRHAYQVVQQSMRGESTYWFHQDVGALLSHLKTFTLLSMQKQLVRNARIMDAEASMAFIYSMATAGVVYTIGQTLKGNTENLTPERVMKGAFMLNNMSGFIPQWTDPVMSMLGMDNLRFNHYGAMGIGGDVIGVPPALTTLNKITHIPMSAAKVATGNYRNADIQALQATPIIGNLYGFSYIFNEMKK